MSIIDGDKIKEGVKTLAEETQDAEKAQKLWGTIETGIATLTKAFEEMRAILVKGILPEINSAFRQLSKNMDEAVESLNIDPEKAKAGLEDLAGSTRNLLDSLGEIEGIKGTDSLKKLEESFKSAELNLAKGSKPEVLKKGITEIYGILKNSAELELNLLRDKNEKEKKEVKVHLKELEEINQKYSGKAKEFNSKVEKAQNKEKDKEDKEKKKKQLDQYKQVTEITLGVAKQGVEMLSKNKKQALEEELADLDKFYTSDKQKARENSNLKYISEEELAKKKADIKNRQAQADKDAAVTQAIIAAILSATKALPNFILAGISLAAGMANAAIIASQKLPQYAKGRVGGSGEFALVGEYGPEVMWIPSEASIVPAHKSRVLNEAVGIAKEYRLPFGSLGVGNFDTSQIQNKPYMAIDYDKLGKSLAKNLPEVSQLNIQMDEQGFVKYLSKGNNVTRSLNSKLN